MTLLHAAVVDPGFPNTDIHTLCTHFRLATHTSASNVVPGNKASITCAVHAWYTCICGIEIHVTDVKVIHVITKFYVFFTPGGDISV